MTPFEVTVECARKLDEKPRTNVFDTKNISAFSRMAESGLPDGIFSNQKSQFGYILECLAMKDVGKFVAISYILGHLVYFVVILVQFSRFGMLYKETPGNPGQNLFAVLESRYVANLQECRHRSYLC
jgi:hypothetical protein